MNIEKIRNFGLTAAVMLTSGSAFAEGGAGGVGEAVSTSVAKFQTDATTAITTIGVAMITVACVAIGFKWAKAALFG